MFLFIPQSLQDRLVSLFGGGSQKCDIDDIDAKSDVSLLPVYQFALSKLIRKKK